MKQEAWLFLLMVRKIGFHPVNVEFDPHKSHWSFKMKSKSVLLSEFVGSKLKDMITSKAALGLLVKGVVHIALSKKLVTDLELHKMFDDAIHKYQRDPDVRATNRVAMDIYEHEKIHAGFMKLKLKHL